MYTTDVVTEPVVDDDEPLSISATEDTVSWHGSAPHTARARHRVEQEVELAFSYDGEVVRWIVV